MGISVEVETGDGATALVLVTARVGVMEVAMNVGRTGAGVTCVQATRLIIANRSTAQRDIRRARYVSGFSTNPL